MKNQHRQQRKSSATVLALLLSASSLSRISNTVDAFVPISHSGSVDSTRSGSRSSNGISKAVRPTGRSDSLTSSSIPTRTTGSSILVLLQMSSNDDDSSSATTSTNSDDEQRLDEYLSKADLRSATKTLKNASSPITIPKDRFLSMFNAIEIQTSEAEENSLNNRARLDMDMSAAQYPPTSPSRNEMTDLYTTLGELGHLQLFGAAGRNDRPLPAMGSKVVTPTLLEQITDMSIVSLTPKPTNTLLLGGIALAFVEGMISVSTGIDLNFLVLLTISAALLDKVVVNGAVFETATRIVMPEYRKKILRHEAGHFLCAYLLGCPVEGCVLSSWAALQDARFGGRTTSVSAGTSFFDRDLSEEMNGQRPLSRDSIDRYSVIVMGGIAAEAINFGRADGGAGDEMALVRFLSSINPRGGGAVTWDADRIKNQARWGAMQAVLLLRQYKASYDALVDALERGGNLGECIYAIEQAARETGEEPLDKPLGYVVERGLHGEWTDVPPSDVTNQSIRPVIFAPDTGVPANGSASKSTSPPEEQEDVSASLEELRMAAEKKLKEIEGKLSEIEKKA